MIRLLRVSDLRAAGQHIERHAHESGRGPDIVFAPFLEIDRHAYEDTREGKLRYWVPAAPASSPRATTASSPRGDRRPSGSAG